MKRILGEIQTGRFATRVDSRKARRQPVFKALGKHGEEHPMEQVGAELRGLMPWLKENRLVDRTKN